jgi:hypothetical protein
MLLWNAGFPQELYRNFTEISSISHENTGFEKNSYNTKEANR